VRCRCNILETTILSPTLFEHFPNTKDVDPRRKRFRNNTYFDTATRLKYIPSVAASMIYRLIRLYRFNLVTTYILLYFFCQNKNVFVPVGCLPSVIYCSEYYVIHDTCHSCIFLQNLDAQNAKVNKTIPYKQCLKLKLSASSSLIHDSLPHLRSYTPIIYR
jgi:hypothetical protein